MKKLLAMATAAVLLFGIAGTTLAQSPVNKTPIQIARQCCAQMDDQVEAAKSRRLLPLFDVEFPAELADETALAVPLR